MKINVEKLKKELSKGDVQQQIEAFNELKAFVTTSLINKQKELEEKSSDLQSVIDKIQGSNSANI
jgi:hypothetical protein